MQEIYKSKAKIKNIGIRHGEKSHETLLSKEEKIFSEDLGKYFRIISDNRDLNYNNYFNKGKNTEITQDYNSKNTNQLNKEELKTLLAKIGYNGS